MYLICMTHLALTSDSSVLHSVVFISEGCTINNNAVHVLLCEMCLGHSREGRYLYGTLCPASEMSEVDST